jgi:hypothetical protein
MNRTSKWLLASGLSILSTMVYLSGFGFRPSESSPAVTKEPSIEIGARPVPADSEVTTKYVVSADEAKRKLESPLPPGKDIGGKNSSRDGQLVEDLSNKFLAISEVTDPGERDLKLQECAASLSNEVMGKVLDRLVEIQSDPSLDELRNALVRIWVGSEPASAAQWAMHLPASETASELLNQVAITWANGDLDSAVHWVDQLPEGDQRKDVVRKAISYEAARINEIVAVNLAMQIPEAQGGDQALDHAVRQWATKTPEAAASWVSQIADKNLRDKLTAAICVEWSAKDPMAAGTLAVTSLNAGRTQNDAVVSIAQRWAKQDFNAAAAWVKRFPEGALKRDASESIAAITKLQ